MASLATHYFFALDVYDALDKETKKRIIEHIDEYLIGAQGPDIFFFGTSLNIVDINFMDKKINNYGKKLHKQAFNTFLEASLGRVKLYNSQLALSYLLGMVTHYALDCFVHPLVNKYTSNFDQHLLFETELDALMIESHTPFKANEFKRHEVVKYDNLYFHSFFKIIYPDLSAMQVYESIKNMYNAYKLIYSPNGYKKQAIKRISQSYLPIPFDFSNMLIGEDKSDAYRKEIKLFIDKYDGYVFLTTKLIHNVLDHLDHGKKLDTFFETDFNNKIKDIK